MWEQSENTSSKYTTSGVRGSPKQWWWRVVSTILKSRQWSREGVKIVKRAAASQLILKLNQDHFCSKGWIGSPPNIDADREQLQGYGSAWEGGGWPRDHCWLWTGATKIHLTWDSDGERNHIQGDGGGGGEGEEGKHCWGQTGCEEKAG